MKALPLYLLLALVVVSCGPESGRFRLEGRFKNLNQGEFFLYDYERGTKDTIAVRDGRFVYDVALADTCVLTLMFPNYSELPIFALPGTKVTIDGDVSHLREVDVKGTDENEQMTAFRLRTNDKMPPDVQHEAAAYIESHASSLLAPYLLRRYLLLGTPQPDYALCHRLCLLMLEAQPHNVSLVRLEPQLATLDSLASATRLPAFSATDTRGRHVDNTQLQAEANVIYLWASWDYTSQSAMRQLNVLKRRLGRRLSIVSIALDGSPAEGRMLLESDSITWPNICDSLLWQSPLLARLGFVSLPASIVADAQGNIVGRPADYIGIREQVEALTGDDSR